MAKTELRITVDVEPITAVDRPVWKGEGVAGLVAKTEDERRYTLTVAYPANRADTAVAADGYRDFAGTDAVEEAAWNYLVKSPQVGLWHADGTEGAGAVVESYIYRGPDWPLTAADGTEQVVKAGDWLLGIQWSEQTWALVKQRLIGGVSMQGTATRRTPTTEALENLRS
jgi:hypothetical protein